MQTAENFQSLQLPPNLEKALIKMGYDTPTPIQAQAIPVGLSKRDLIGCAQTGTGKTAAFLIPMIAHLLKSPRKTGLVLLPTRELATQVAEVLKSLTEFSPDITSVVVIGGVPMPGQTRKLQKSPRVIIATPGRLVDHLRRGNVSLRTTEIVVLDEADRMLDMGFAPQITEVMRFVPSARQTLLFSATLPSEIVKLSSKYMKDPLRVNAGAANKPVEKVDQQAVQVAQGAKKEKLKEELKTRSGAVIVFTRTKHRTDSLYKFLLASGHSAGRIHGGRSQGQRTKAIEEFRRGQTQILVATDIAARGIDIANVAHVINFDLPQTPEDYVHRIGRTARAGAQGKALSFFTPEERGEWHQISHFVKAKGAVV